MSTRRTRSQSRGQQPPDNDQYEPPGPSVSQNEQSGQNATDEQDRPQSVSSDDYSPISKNQTQIILIINDAIRNYEHLHDYDLWYGFSEDFGKWTEQDFRKAPAMLLARLRLLLQGHGVYVPITPHPATALIFTLTEENGPQWNEERLLELIEYGGGCESPRIKHLYPQFFQERPPSRQPIERLSPRTSSNPLPAQTAPTPKIFAEPRMTANPTTEPAYEALNSTSHQAPTATYQQAPGPTYNPSAPVFSTPNLNIEPNTYPDEDRRTTHAIIQLSKIYSEDIKYSGSDDVFEWKYLIFQDYCRRVGLPQTELARRAAFPSMLRGQALSYYYTNERYWQGHGINPKEGITTYFEGKEHQRSKQKEWSNISLQRTIDDEKNAGKSIKECLEIMLQNLQKLYYGLPHDMRNETQHHFKIVEATRGHPACEWATAKPSSTIPRLIEDLRSNVGQYHDKMGASGQHQTAPNNDSFYTDRRYHGQRSRTPFRTRNNRILKDKRCYVCRKLGCFSTKHSKEEREAARRLFLEGTKERAIQYLTEQDKHDAESDTEDEIVIESAEALLTETDRDEKSLSHALFSSTFIASKEPSDMEESIVQDLIERTANHYITAILTPAESSDVIGQPITPRVRAKTLSNQDLLIPTETGDLHTAFTLSSRYSKDVFQGLLLDTGAADFSTAGYDQYVAYKKIDKNAILDETTAGTANIKFGAGEPLQSIGSVDVTTPIGKIRFHVINASTPFLLSLKDLDRLKVYFDNTRDVLVGPKPDMATPIVRRFGHPFLVWGKAYGTYLIESFDQNPCFLTEAELRRIHRRFGHPSTERLRRVLERAGHEVDSDTIEHIRKFCHHCQIHGKSPGRFKFTLRDDIHFNHTIIIDIMYIDNKPVLHAVDEATRFTAACWLPDLTAKTVWDTFRMMWIDTYVGPPDFIMTDAGKNFTSKEFSQLAGNVGTNVKTVPVEAHWSIGIVERYHGILRRIYFIIREELPSLANTRMLQMAVKAINDTAGPDGLVPTLLVFGAYPRLVDYDPPAPSVTKRAAVLKKATAEVRRLFAQRQTNDALNTRNGPSSAAILSLPINSDVLIWREGKTGHAGNWTGPYKLLATNGETCTVQVSNKPTEFRSTVVRPYHKEETPDLDKQSEESTNSEESANQVPEPPMVVIPPFDPTTLVNYGPSREKELNGLLDKGVFEIVDKEDIPGGARIFNTRFVDEIKNPGTAEAFEKSRLVVQAYNDSEKELVLTQSPTIQRSSERCLLCVATATIGNGRRIYLRDVTQAYVQSATSLNREFFVRPPPELAKRLPNGSILKVVKPLYGIPEAGNHWFKTYHKFHKEKLKMTCSTYDACLLHCNNKNDGFGIIAMQTDDTLMLADDRFAKREEHEIEAASILCKPRQQLTPSTPLKFNGAIISEDGQGITLTQERTLKRIQLINDQPIDIVSSRGKLRKDVSTYEQYVSQRALGAYAASMSQPEAAFDLSYAAQTTSPEKADIDALNKRLQWQLDNAERGLRFVKIDMTTARLFVFADASFAGNKDLSSQIGYVIVLADANGNANIIHWSSTKCKRVTRSVLASELYALAHAFDTASAIKATLTQLLHHEEPIPLVVCTDSKSLYDCLVKLGTTQEKRLMIDLMCLREAFERKEIDEVKWIDGNSNPADAMTKAKPCLALKNLIDTNKLQLRVEGWTERTSTSQN